MKVISFDIGIKNMAYCVLSITDDNDNPIIIHDWDVINMIKSSTINKEQCTCEISGKNKNTPTKKCTAVAKYSKNGELFCLRHAKSNKKWSIPTKENTLVYLKKLKVDELKKICNAHMLLNNNDKPTVLRADLIKKLDDFYTNICFELIKTSKSKNANEVDLIEIGKNMKVLMNKLPDIESITHVFIENQISPIANRMKTIQGMLAQYFIMKSNIDIHIEFVSSSHKLGQFKNIFACEKSQLVETKTTNTTNPNYKEHKLDSIHICQTILDNNICLIKWNNALNTSKKDDLADAFLQGLWYFKRQNNILYADDLNIKLV